MGNCIERRMIKYSQKTKNGCWKVEEDGSVEMDVKGPGEKNKLFA